MKVLKIGAWSGILLLAVFALIFILSFVGIFSLILIYILAIIASILMLLFLWAFVILGKKTNNTLLKVSAWALFVLGILGIIFSIILAVWISSNPWLSAMMGGNVPSSENFNLSQFEGMSESEINTLMSQQITIPTQYQAMSTIIQFASVVFIILFAVGLIKLKKEFKIAKTAGILYILIFPIMLIGVYLMYSEISDILNAYTSGQLTLPATFIFGVLFILGGIVIALIAFILSIKLLFKTSVKYEKRGFEAIKTTRKRKIEKVRKIKRK